MCWGTYVHPYIVGRLVVLRGEREIVGVPIPCVALGSLGSAITCATHTSPVLYVCEVRVRQSGQALKSDATASYVRNAHKRGYKCTR